MKNMMITNRDFVVFNYFSIQNNLIVVISLLKGKVDVNLINV